MWVTVTTCPQFLNILPTKASDHKKSCGKQRWRRSCTDAAVLNSELPGEETVWSRECHCRWTISSAKPPKDQKVGQLSVEGNFQLSVPRPQYQELVGVGKELGKKSWCSVYVTCVCICLFLTFCFLTL